MITIAISEAVVLSLLLPVTFVVVSAAVIRAGKLWIDLAPDSMAPRYWMD